MKAPENPRSLPRRVARTVGYAAAAIAYLSLLVIAGADAGPVAEEPVASQVEVAANLR